MRKIIPLFLTTLSLQAYTPFKTVESPFSILKKNTQEKTQLSASTQSNPKAIPAIAITTWTNQAGDDLWQSSLNWDNGVPSDSSYQANFDVAQATSIDFGNASCGSLQFTNKAQQNSFTNGTLTLSGINSSLIEVINEYQKITSDVICLSDGTISIQEGAALAFDIGTPSGNLAGNNTNLTIVGPGLFRNASLIGSIGGSVFNNINIINGSIENTGKFGSSILGTITLSSGTFFNAGGAIVAPYVQNAGCLQVASGESLVLSFPTQLNSGSVDATGASLNFDNAIIAPELQITSYVPITAKSVIVDIKDTAPTVFTSFGSINTGFLTINPMGTLRGSCSISGNINQESGVISPGSDSTLGTFNLIDPGKVSFASIGGTIQIKLDQSNSDQIIASGTVAISGPEVIEFSVLNEGSGQTVYPFFSSPNIIFDKAGTISYVFPQGYGDIFSVQQSGGNLSLVANYPTPVPPNPNPFPQPGVFSGNARTMAELMNAINGNCLPSTQGIIDEVAQQSIATAEQSLLELSPQFKVIQFSLEKLTFQIQKELDSDLYSDDTGTRIFEYGGYDYLKQSISGTYTGYKVNSFYQLFGATHGYEKLKFLGVIGVSESWMNLYPIHSSANYNTVYGVFGAAGHFKRWHFGIKSLYGYSFSNTEREIPSFNLYAKSSHGLWNLNTEGLISYNFATEGTEIKAYESFGYIYGVENPYTEHHATGNNLHVKNEKLSLCRNSLGFNVMGPSQASNRLFLDAAWVYEFYTRSNNFQARFVGTGVYGKFSQKNPTSNYARLGAGIVGTHKKFSYRLAYDGLFGKRFIEQSASLKLGYTF